jgi:hypothetical protein
MPNGIFNPLFALFKILQFVKYLLPIVFFIFSTKNIVAQNVFDSPIPIDSLKIGTCQAQCILMKDAILAKKIIVTYIPPQFDTIVENVEISPAFTYYALRPNASIKPLVDGERVSLLPPKMDIKQNRFKIFEGYNKELWRESEEHCLGIKPSLCIVLCKVEVPAEYKSLKYKVLIEPAKIVRQRSDATLVETIEDTSSLLIKMVEPPQYFKVKKLLKRKSSYFHVASPFDVQHLLSDWRKVPCYCDDCFSNTVRKIQRALNERGYKVVEDDIFGPETKKAFIQFQKDFNLPHGNLNVETLEALGIEGFKPPAPFSRD